MRTKTMQLRSQEERLKLERLWRECLGRLEHER